MCFLTLDVCRSDSLLLRQLFAPLSPPPASHGADALVGACQEHGFAATLTLGSLGSLVSPSWETSFPPTLLGTPEPSDTRALAAARP